MESILESYGFHEWLCKTNFSFLVGASHPRDLVSTAINLGYSSLCINDFDGVYGLARTYREIVRLKKQHPNVHLKLNYGAEVHLAKDHDLPLLLHDTLVLGAKNWEGYNNLCKLLSFAHREGKHYAHIPRGYLLSAEVKGLFAIQPMRGFIRSGQMEESFWANLQEHFGGELYFAVSRHLHSSEDCWIQATMDMAKKLNARCLLSQDVFFHHRKEKILSDLLHSIRTNKVLGKCKEHFFPNGERTFHDLKSLERLYKDLPIFQQAIKTSSELNEECVFSFSQLKYRYPKEMIPENYTAQEFLEKLTWEGAKAIYGQYLPDKIIKLIHHEIELIKTLEFADYFLTVWDIVKWARSQDILCQGRGSAANSVVCFCLGITSVDPNSFDLLFERFISQERGDPPDIDVDFEHERREEVVQYIYKRYGRERAAMVANVITYRRKGAMRAVGKSLGAPDELIADMSKMTESKYFRRMSSERIVNELKADKKFQSNKFEKFPWKLWLELSEKLKGFPRHLGIHSGGFILSDRCLSYLVAQEPASMEGRSIIQWCKEDIEGLGFFKIDILCLGILTAIGKCFSYIETAYGKKIDFYSFRHNDLATYAMMRRADTVGTFQIESRAQMTMLPRLRPQEFYDLVIQIAIIRPGPIQGKVIHPFLARRSRKVKVTFPDPRLEPILKRTLGVPIFQEQLMQIAMVVGDFTPGEANELRKNIGAWNIKEFERDINPWIEKLERGMKKNGFAKEFIDQIVGQMKGFADYGFPESHAISFAFIAYVSCYLKCHYPAAYFTGVLNSQPMGFYSPHALLQTAQREGVQVLPVDINKSYWDNSLEPVEPSQEGSSVYGIRLGFRLVDSLSKTGAKNIVKSRENIKAWESLDHFIQNVSVYRDDFTALAAANAFYTFGVNRAEALWYAEAVPFKPLIDIYEKPIQWQEESKMAQIQKDFNSFKTTLGEHPVEVIKQESWSYEISTKEIVSSEKLDQKRNHQIIHTFGMITVRQSPPSAKGMVFLTMEDKQGFINLVFTPDIYEKFYPIVDKQAFLCVQGKLQKVNEYTSVLVKKVYEPQLHQPVSYCRKKRRIWKQVGYQSQELVKSRNF